MAFMMTGMGSDGTRGFGMIKEKGGFTAAQSTSTCIISGMPKSAIDANVVDWIFDLHQIPAAITKIAAKE
jgi:two-component system chemotaxis response regulator CheB